MRVSAAEDGALQVLLHQCQHRKVQGHLVGEQAADGRHHARAGLGGDVQVAVDVFAVYLADGDHYLVGHHAHGGLGDAGRRGLDVGIRLCRTELQGGVTLPLDRLDDEDVTGACVHRALKRRHAHAAYADDSHVLTRPDVSCAHRGPIASSDAAADQAGNLKRYRRVDLDHRGPVHHHVRREGAEQRHRVHVLAASLDPEGAVGNRRPAEEQGTDVAQVAQPRLTRRAFATGRDERQHNVIAWREVLDSRTDLGHDACALVAAEHRESRHRDAAGDQVVIGVAHPGRLHLDLHLVLDGVADLDLLDLPRLVELPDESAFRLHRVLLSSENCSDRLSYLSHTSSAGLPDRHG